MSACMTTHSLIRSREVGIDDAHDRRVGQGRIGEEMIDAGAEREDRLEGSAGPSSAPGGWRQLSA